MHQRRLPVKRPLVIPGEPPGRLRAAHLRDREERGKMPDRCHFAVVRGLTHTAFRPVDVAQTVLVEEIHIMFEVPPVTF